MKNSLKTTRITTTILMAAAFSVATLSAPQPAKADAGFIAFLGGAALFATLYSARNQELAQPRASVTQTLIHPSTDSLMYGSPTSAAIVYSLASPMHMNAASNHPMYTYTQTIPSNGMGQPMAATSAPTSGVILYQAETPVVANISQANQIQ